MGSSEFINCETKAIFFKPFLFKYGILFALFLVAFYIAKKVISILVFLFILLIVLITDLNNVFLNYDQNIEQVLSNFYADQNFVPFLVHENFIEFIDKNTGFPDVTTITLEKSSSDNFLFESNNPVGFSLANNQQTPWEKYFFAILHGECN